jgi:hypothetical protein
MSLGALDSGVSMNMVHPRFFPPEGVSAMGPSGAAGSGRAGSAAAACGDAGSPDGGAAPGLAPGSMNMVHPRLLGVAAGASGMASAGGSTGVTGSSRAERGAD